jgi:pectate lyase
MVLTEGSSNVIIRCLNFIGYGWPNIAMTDPGHAQPSYNFIWLAGGSNRNGTISNVLVDRCTFTRATGKAFDITNGDDFTSTTTNVTFQRNLIHDNALGSLVKYADGVTVIRRNISYHHNVWAHGGERQPQIVDNVGPLDYVNNVVYTNAGDVSAYPDGSQLDAYGLRVWNTSAAGQVLRLAGSADAFHGDVTINVVANAFLGNRGNIMVLTDSSIPGDPFPASSAGNYVSADNYFNPPSNAPLLFSMIGATTTGATTSTPSLPWNSPNMIPLAYQVTTLPVNQLATQMLPYIGAPNRTALDQQRINEVAAQLPGSTTRPVAPTNLRIY